MRHSVILKKASLVGAFFVSLLCVDLAQAFCPQRGDLAQVAVRQVVDGDTVRLTDGRSIRLIGINTAIYSRSGAPGSLGIGFATPISTARLVLDSPPMKMAIPTTPS